MLFVKREQKWLTSALPQVPSMKTVHSLYCPFFLEYGWPLNDIWDADSSHSNSFHHCCQLKSSLLPKTKKNPRMVANMTVFPVRTSAQAPHLIYGERKDKVLNTQKHKRVPIQKLPYYRHTHNVIVLWMRKDGILSQIVLFNANHF